MRVCLTVLLLQDLHVGLRNVGPNVFPHSALLRQKPWGRLLGLCGSGPDHVPTSKSVTGQAGWRSLAWTPQHLETSNLFLPKQDSSVVYHRKSVRSTNVNLCVISMRHLFPVL